MGGATHLIDSRGMTMTALAGVLPRLSQDVDRPVFDMTGLTGVFDIIFDVDTDSGRSIFTALQEQLGLKLEARKAPVEILVIEHATKPSNN
jgi:uncharacterized protein (TIGR03435 family)